jgi:hypothetical protein
MRVEEAVGQYVWVNSIDLSVLVRGKSTNAKAAVLVWDQDDSPVKGAMVYSHWDGLTTDSDVFTTKGRGTGSCSSNKLKSPTGWWYYYVDDVVKEGYAFRSDFGETSDEFYAAGVPWAGEAQDVLSVFYRPLVPSGAEFSLGVTTNAHVRFAIYSVSGQLVRTLVDQPMPAGSHTIVWDCTDVYGKPVSSGLYFYRVTSDDDVVTKKIVLMK